ncbi:LuxR C-terminal-related transcriptional regulator [Oceanobacillus halotolerans]|uniref:LuxR C-terminal-related transcriptional regulator n=1 Tax=Oceanobacillus halotolerans TaxID=2663380 RepID=UPI0013DBEE12|nr:LuxR C-terminal-related transcriptional regulator [Oceanobacillus halotolerans]
MKHLELLKELQSIYAERYGLTIITTDSSGQLLVEKGGKNELCKILYESFVKQVKENVKRNWQFRTPVFYDIWPGIYTIVTPIHIEGGHTYMLWAGLFIEEDTAEFVKKQLSQMDITQRDWDLILANTPEITQSNREEILHANRKLAALIELCLKESEGQNLFQLQNQLFQQAFTTKNDMEALFHDFISIYQTFDFFGLASKQQGDTYEVTHIVGENTATFQGVQFVPGEGFLGRVIITDERGFLDNANQDPRTLMFRQSLESQPKSLFACPIKQQNGEKAVFFGGSFTNSRISKTSQELVKMIAAIAEVRLQMDMLQSEQYQQLNRLTALIEICKLMAITPDVKRIIYILVDISLNLVEGGFSCLVLHDKETDNMNVVSRGNWKGHMEEYVKDAAKRYQLENRKQYQPEAATPHVHEVSWGASIIECPLIYRDQLLGILCVGTTNQSNQVIEKHANFLQTLAIIGGVSLQLASRGEENYLDQQVNTLFRAIQQFDNETFTQLEKATNMAGEFATKQGLAVPMIKAIVQACQLSYYSASFLEETLQDSHISMIVQEAKILMDQEYSIKWEETSVPAQIVALTLSYTRNHSIEDLKQKSGNTTGLIESFTAFINETQIQEDQISLKEEINIEKKLHTVSTTIKELNLSPREQEVLDLVIQGFNNKQIAEQLYISGHTVKNHVTKIFQKLNVPDRAHAISKVYQMRQNSS